MRVARVFGNDISYGKPGKSLSSAIYCWKQFKRMKIAARHCPGTYLDVAIRNARSLHSERDEVARGDKGE